MEHDIQSGHCLIWSQKLDFNMDRDTEEYKNTELFWRKCQESGTADQGHQSSTSAPVTLIPSPQVTRLKERKGRY